MAASRKKRRCVSKQCDLDRPDVACFKAQPGDVTARVPSAPEISLVRGGKRRTYLWVGNDRRIAGQLVDGWCFAWLKGEKALRELALAILEEVGDGR